MSIPPATAQTVTTISVIIPNYNKAKTLGACLDAVFAQTHPPTEVIVVDDASSDASPEIARRYPCRLVRFPHNRGVSAARNTGAECASGDVLFFVDSDIGLAPDALEAALRELADDPSCVLVQGIYDKRPLIDDGPVERYRVLCEHFWRLRVAGVVPVTLFALSAVRREAVEAVGGFREDLRDAEDIEWGTRLPPGARVRMSGTILGRHDDVDRLLPFVAEQYRRSRAFVSLVRAGSRPQRLRAFSPAALLAVGGMVGALTASAVAAGFHLAGTGALLLCALACFAGFLVIERGLFGFVARDRGPVFLIYFVGVHVLLYATTLAGAVAGVLTGGRLR